MKYIKNTLLVLLILYSLSSEASHLAGSTISFRYLSVNRYELTFKVYRDCRGLPLDTLPEFTVFKDVNQVITSYPLTCNRTSIRDITFLCPSEPKPCNPANQTTGIEGIEEHVFMDTVDFSVSPFNNLLSGSNCKIWFSISQCCRNGVINNINPGYFYNETWIDICNAPVNNSPQFSNDPVFFQRCNTPSSYSSGAYDPNQSDSLSFSLTDALYSHNQKAIYTNNFTAKIPATPYCPASSGVIDCKALPKSNPPRGFYFNDLTGEIIYTPTKCDEVSVITEEVTEWRKDQNGTYRMISNTRHDMQVNVYTANGAFINNPPKITSPKDTFIFYTGIQKSFTLSTSDIKSDTMQDTVSLKIKSPLAGSYFRVDSNLTPQGIFTWTAPDSAAGHTFVLTFRAVDNNCPKPLFWDKSIVIYVKDSTKSPILAIKQVNLHNVKIYPNPASEYISIESPSGFKGRAVLYNSAGIAVYESTLQGGTKTFNTSAYAKGLYILKIESQGVTDQSTIVIQ